MAKKTPVEQFDAEMQRILKQYEEEIETTIDEEVEATAKATAKMIRASARSTFGGSGKYAKGWTQKETSTGRLKEYTVHNKNAYQLAHLLEYGHVKVIYGHRTGGTVSGREHIASASEYASKHLEQRIRVAIGRA